MLQEAFDDLPNIKPGAMEIVDADDPRYKVKVSELLLTSSNGNVKQRYLSHRQRETGPQMQHPGT